MNNLYTFRALAFFGMGLALTACGGGGGGGSSDIQTPLKPIGITAENAEAVAGSAQEALVAVELGSGLTPAGITNTIETRQVTIYTLSEKLLRDALSNNSSASSNLLSLPLALDLPPQNCLEGGTISVSENGDSITLTFNQCEEFPGEVIHGSIYFTDVVINQTTLDMSMTAAFDSLSITYAGETITFDGGYTMAVINIDTNNSGYPDISEITIDTTDFSLSGAGQTSTIKQMSVVMTIDINTNESSITGSATISDTILGGTYTVSINGDFDLENGGAMTIEGNGSSLVLTVNIDGSYTLDVDENGDGIYEMQLIGSDWMALA